MYKSKKELDQHVRNSLAKLRTENEKNLRSFTIAKLYFNINEYSTAEQYISSYLSIKDDNDQAHKLLGKCYLQQKRHQKALAAFQRSLQLNSNQPDLLGEVCQLLLDDKDLNTGKAKYWCDLAERENVKHDAVFSLRLKLMSKDNLDTNQVEQMIQKEISLRSHDVNLRICLVRHLLEQNKTLDAFQYIYQLEMANHGMLSQSPEWYNVVWMLLGKYEQIPNSVKDWQFWLLVITCLERQVYLSFSNTNITETANLLFRFDQYLFKVSQLVNTLNQQKELVTRFMDHYQGQLCLYAASLIFKRELIQNKYKSKETIKTSLPILLLAYQSTGGPDIKEQWMKHCDQHGSQLLQQWNKEGAFRCVQAGRTLLACLEEHQITNKITDETAIGEIRKVCADTNWRRGVFNQLFCNSDQKVKENTSHFMRCSKLATPNYKLPTYAELEQHGEIAQYLNTQSLEHMVYLCLGNDNLAHVRANFFSEFNFSTDNLSCCGAETLNQLDIETFMYATTLQVESLLKIERSGNDCYHQGSVPKPKVLPFVNMRHQLCTEEQADWWQSAYQVYKNLANENLAEIRATLQYGIEVVRGINGPKSDMLIVFKLGKIFETRASDASKPTEKAMLETRAENLYKHALSMLKMNNKGILEPFKRYFKIANCNNSSQEREILILAEDATNFLAVRYLKNCEYEDLIEEFNGIEVPFATYYQSEAYRKLDELAKETPKKNKGLYIDKANECLNHTQQLLKSCKFDPSHPLNSVVHFKLKNLQQIKSKLMNDQNYNCSIYEDAISELSVGDTSIRSRRENSIGSPRTVEIENMVKQFTNVMMSVKTDLGNTIEVHGNDIKDIKDRLSLIEDMLKKLTVQNRDEDAADAEADAALEDLYIIEDEFQSQLNTNQQQQQMLNNMYGSNYSQPHSMGQRLHTPTAVNSGGMVNVPGAGIPSYNNPLYGNYAMNYYAQQLMMPPQPQPSAAPPIMGTHQSQLQNRNPLGMSYMDSQMNFNLPGLNPSLLMQPTTLDSRSSNIFGLLGQNSQQQPQLLPPVQQPPPSLAPSMQQQPQIVGQPIQQQQQPPPPPPATQSTTLALPSAAPITFNKSLNNTPVEKGPPVNVVITSSDPLPTTSVTMQPQPALSVTIPSHHIKPNLISTKTTTNTSFPMIGTTSTVTFSTSITSPFSMKFSSPLTTTTTAAASSAVATTTTTSASPMTFSFRPPSPKVTDNNLNKTNDSNTSDLHNSEHEVEYDPRPDFKPIIPLPDEIEVKTGEENEQVMFSARSKLFRFANKEWKERGVGDLKILKNNDNGTSRILMRRDQTHKICANHRITSELNLTKPKNNAKGFIWAANDFADEELKLEKFLVRFKDVAIEKQFESAFNVARNEDIELSKGTNAQIDMKSKNSALELAKTFKTSTPTIKPPESTSNTLGNTKSTAKPINLFAGGNKGEETKSPFENLNFYTPKNGTENRFDNLFANINKSPLGIASESYYTPPPGGNESKIEESKPDNNHYKSDNEDEYVPTAQFQPVIPLPDLVEVTTGEESETILFEHRAKLFRFDKTTSEWKERGIGNIKVLQDKNDVNNVRLVMRREVIHKLCCNQRLYKDTNFQYSKNSKTSLMWVGQDYSENELQTETLTIRFKTADACKEFLDTIAAAQGKMTNAANEKNAEKTENLKTTSDASDSVVKGFGDKFKPKAGSWSCQQCYTSNTADKLYCASCEGPKDETVPKKGLLDTSSSSITLSKPTFNFGFSNANKSNNAATATQSFVATEAVESAKQTSTLGFGDKFKPKEGSWSCEQCYTSNTAEKLHCASCEAPKDKTVPKKDTNNSLVLSDSNSSKFTFGFANTAQKSTAEVSATGFGDKFKPKVGSWSCSECYLSNAVDDNYCKACDNPKDSTIPKKDPVNILAPSNPSAKFNFGFKAVAGNTAASESVTPSFTFGKTTGNSNIFGSNLDSSVSTNIFSSKLGESKTFSFSPATSTTTESANLLTTTATTTGTMAKSTFSFTLPSKTIDSSSNPDKGVSGNEFSLDKKDFNFVLKPRTPNKAKTLNTSGGAADDDDNEVVEEEENNTYFTPAIPLPDKIEVKTGEEDEDVVYTHRAKLYKYTDSEWKERGLGDVKILRHKVTKKLRVVMRREMVFKICLNHVLNKDVIYKNKDEKSWLFVVNDYSEGEVEVNKFCLRFRTSEIADNFMKAVKDCLALDDNTKPIDEASTGRTEQLQESDVSSSSKEINISDESKRIADTLLLPYSFFDESSIVDCPGCIGCDPDKFVFPDSTSLPSLKNQTIPLDSTNVSIPKPSSWGIKFESFKTEPSNVESKSIFGGLPSGSGFSFTEALNSITNNTTQNSNFVFGGGNTGSNLFGDKNVFGSTQSNGTSHSLFGNKSNPLAKSILQNSLFEGQQKDQDQIGPVVSTSNNVTGTSEGFNSTHVTFGGSTNSSVFGSKPSIFGGGLQHGNVLNTTTGTSVKPTFDKTGGNLFASSQPTFADLAKQTQLQQSASTDFAGLPFTNSLSFADLAKQTTTQDKSPQPPATGGFIGLTHTNAFSNFKSQTDNADEADPDPHFEPIIPLPEEITLSTGEEDETVIFGERATLFRYDQDKKEWKERGVGQLKILRHKTKDTYRMVMRRELIHKLVLNHGIGADFSFKPMGNSPKAFIWATLNYAENAEGNLEKLSCRFRQPETANKFNQVLSNCLEIVKNRPELEPEAN